MAIPPIMCLNGTFRVYQRDEDKVREWSQKFQEVQWRPPTRGALRWVEGGSDFGPTQEVNKIPAMVPVWNGCVCDNDMPIELMMESWVTIFNEKKKPAAS